MFNDKIFDRCFMLMFWWICFGMLLNFIVVEDICLKVIWMVIIGIKLSYIIKYVYLYIVEDKYIIYEIENI